MPRQLFLVLAGLVAVAGNLDAAEPRIMSPSDMRKMIHNDLKKWTEVAKTAGIKVQ